MAGRHLGDQRNPVGISQNGGVGTPNILPNTIILMTGIPNKGTLYFRKPPCAALVIDMSQKPLAPMALDFLNALKFVEALETG